MRSNATRDKWLIAALIAGVLLFGVVVGYYVLHQPIVPTVEPTATTTLPAGSSEATTVETSAMERSVAEVLASERYRPATETIEPSTLSAHVEGLSSADRRRTLPETPNATAEEVSQKTDGNTTTVTIDGQELRLERGVRYRTVIHLPGTRTPEQESRSIEILHALKADPPRSEGERKELLEELQKITSTTTTPARVVRYIWFPRPGQTKSDKPSEEESVELIVSR